MLRHVIAPVRFFSQISNEIIRHPRLSSDAVRLLVWQLSLPAESRQSLSETAVRAGIKKRAFQNAKEQLKDEGYVHEWREQVARGRWQTRQLVSGTPLSCEDAARVRDECAAPAPTDDEPVVGEPTRRDIGRLPDNPPGTNTLQPSASASPAQLTEAEQCVDSLEQLDPRLRVPRAMLSELAALAAQWLAAGFAVDGVRAGILQQLPMSGEAVHRPGGLVRYVLRQVPALDTAAPAAPAPPPRVAQMVECAGDRHTQPLLFRPVAGEDLCPACRQSRAEVQLRTEPVAVRGAAAARAALEGARGSRAT
ncbi:hypothetical protein [Streptomyces sp. NBC_01465]|uniref:hypothetical protein n=1 Tax=Streptomyces sp. NBC_01465 TaxID=2903878 RepID=UPI002E342A77|nr:hypothetical protein [Streptomyces sp. NBC_01465]